MRLYKLIFLLLFTISGYSSPTNPQVIEGILTQNAINANETSFQVSDKTIINWESFSIKADETINFFQPNEFSTLLNRVTGKDQSELLGRLNANGKIFLINPNGILIGKDATINVGSFLASTLNITDTDFLNSNLRFISPGIGSIINYGTIKTKSGDITLFGKTIINEGLLESSQDFNVGLGEEIFLQPDGDEKVIIQVKLNSGDGFKNINQIKAIKHEIKANGTANSYAINLDGEIQKSPLEKTEGKFYLSAIGGKITISKHITQDNIDISGYEIDLAKDITIQTNTNGKIDINSENQLNLNGNLSAPSGNINITHKGSEKVCFLSGNIDVSGSAGGTIAINIPKLINTGSIKADSSKDVGGSITINTNKMIEVQDAIISAKGDSIGGSIEIFAKDHYFTSATHLVDGTNEGGTIRITTLSDSLDLISNKMSATGILEGQIILASNSNLKMSKSTKLLGSLSLNQQMLSVSLDPLTIVDLVDPNDGGLGFGDVIVPLSSGNVVVTKPADNLNGANSGACYLYNGNTLALISQIVGDSASDQVSSGGVTELSNGNYVVLSPSWINPSGPVSNAGAATWGNGSTGISGTVGTGNSLYGSGSGNSISSGGVLALTNGNYVVLSPSWDNPSGPVSNVGAATWGNGSTGIIGIVGTGNSLYGSTSSDAISSNGGIALTNGNYVVFSPNWINPAGPFSNAGAVTWGDGSTGITGAVTAANSLVGTTSNDQVGLGGVSGNDAVALTNGNYVVGSYLWNNGGATDAGAATWGDGTTGITGAVSAANSLVGSTASDNIARNGIIALTNGNYVVLSPFWNNGGAGNAGAATWGDGSTGITGAVSSANSLVGSNGSDSVGLEAIVLTNGNYVILSSNWRNGGATRAGAATWVNGSTGITGAVSSANSLVGTQTNDNVGIGSLGGGPGGIALTNGNYVVFTYNWNNGVLSLAGAAIWGNGSTGITGNVTTANSLYGLAGDHVSERGGIALSNGNYVIFSDAWDGFKGAATWGDGSTGITGAVSISNSIVGTQIDTVGEGGGIALTNGNFLVSSFDWNNGATSQAGAATWGNGATGTAETVSSSNSLVGFTNADVVSLGFNNVPAVALSSSSLDGSYMVSSRLWDNGGTINAGAATFSFGTTDNTVGAITSSNSIIGKGANAGLENIVEETVYGKVYVSFANDNVSGRVAVMTIQTLPPTPTPTPSVFTFNQKVKISDTSFAARNEMFVFLHPLNEYINQYLEFKILKNEKQFIIERKKMHFFSTPLPNQVLLKPLPSSNKIILERFFIREKNNNAISTMQEPKTL